MKHPELGRCPYCSQTDSEELGFRYHGTVLQGKDLHQFWATCSCGASGSMQETKAKAIEEWNRVSKMAEKPKPFYLVAMSGQGDSIFFLVNGETWAWVQERAAPIPDAQLKALIERDGASDIAEAIECLRRLKGSSPKNDRALLAAPDMGDSCDNIADMIRFIRENNVEILDAFQGVIY